ncbi:MAG: hypothetical protein HQK72_08955 [Desulfamplus sp.]|nr:hypothetical protein [Desulfamplus sp.]
MKPESIQKQFMTLDEDEKAILDSVENDEWIACYETSEEFNIRKTELMKAAQNTLNAEKETEIIIHTPQNILRNSLKKKRGVTGRSLLKYAGLILPDDLRVISDAVKIDCGRIDNNEW